MTTWEYLILSLPTFEAAKATQGLSPAVDILNREGSHGWEAIGMSVLADGGVAVLLKRPATAEHESRRGRPMQSRPTEPRADRNPSG